VLHKVRAMVPESDSAHAEIGAAMEALRTATQAPAVGAEPEIPDYAVEINRLRNVIQAACSGGLDHMIERWKVLFPDAPVPTVRQQADNWQQYATEREDTAQQVIERHRKEHESLLRLLAQARTELGRAYRCIQGMHNALNKGSTFDDGYHSLTLGAAKRFVFEGAIDGSDYFVGKKVEVLHAALALPESNVPVQPIGGA